MKYLLSPLFFILLCCYFYTCQLYADIEKNTQRGPVTVHLRLSPGTPKIGDSLTFILTVTAKPQVEVLMPEFAQSLASFTILDFVPKQTIDAQGNTILSQTYTLIPPTSGQLYIPPISIEFVDHRPGMRAAPEDEDAYEILTELLTFQVASIAPKDVKATLKPPLATLPLQPSPSSSATSTYILEMLLLLLLITFIIGFFWWRKKTQKNRKETAYERATQKLQQLLQQDMPDNREAIDQLFVTLSHIVRHYLEDRFQLHAPELTTEEFLDIAAQSPDLTNAHRHFLQDFLQRADQVKFAQYLPDAEAIKQSLYAAKDFLEQTKPVEVHHA